MSTTVETVVTVTPNSYGAHLPEPTDLMRQAVAHRDAGLNNVQIGEQMGITDGSAGNHVTKGLRRMNRADEVDTKGKGAKKSPAPPMIRTRAQLIQAAIEQELVKLHAARDRANARVTDAQAAVDTFDRADWVASETEKREAAVTAAQDALKAFVADHTSQADAEYERLVSAREAIDVSDELAAIDAAIAEFGADE